MSFYHYRQNDRANNLIGGRAIHFLHYHQAVLLGICWQRSENSMIELAVFGLFFRWYFRVRSNTCVNRIKQYKLGYPQRVISEIWLGWLGTMQ